MSETLTRQFELVCIILINVDRTLLSAWDSADQYQPDTIHSAHGPSPSAPSE